MVDATTPEFRGIRNNTAGVREIGGVVILPGMASRIPVAGLNGNPIAEDWRKRGEIDVLANIDDVDKVNAGQDAKIVEFVKKAEAKAEEQKKDEEKK